MTDSSHALSHLTGHEQGVSLEAQEKLRGELAELRARFTGMVVRGPMPFVVLDREGFIRETNEAACNVLDHPSEKLLDLGFDNLVDSRDKRAFTQHLHRCHNGSPDPVVTELRLRTGEQRLMHVQLVSNVFHRHGSDHYQTALIDQSSLKQRAEELKDAHQFSENIVQTIRQPLAVLDQNMAVVTFNRAFSQSFSVVERRAANSFFDKLLQIRNEGRTLRDRLESVLGSREPAEDIRVELPAQVKGAPVPGDRGSRTLLISARPFYRQTRNTPLLLVSIEDITGKELAEAALRREQTMLARAEALAHVGGWEWRLDIDELTWSDELYNIFGVEKSSFKPNFTRYLELIHPADRAAVDGIIRKGLNSGKPIDFYHRIWRGKEIRVLHCQGYFAFDANGHPNVLMGIAQDVTELRKVEEQLRTANRALEERSLSLQRSNEEMQAFSYSIAHDLRAPLRAIQGMSRILMEDYAAALDKDGQEYFGRIMEAAQRMDDLIRDLLDYARITTVQLPVGPVDTEAVWARVIANYTTEIEGKKAIVEKAQPFPFVHAHRTVVELALNNLMGNALKFFPNGVVPYVKVWTEQRPENRIRFNILDKGIGIAPEHQQRIFRVFERLHPNDAYPGTGIGLAIVKKGIERVGGAIGLISKPGEGSTFWFELPSMQTM